MVSRTACNCGISTLEAQREQIQFFDEGINNPNWVVFADIVVKAFGQHRGLLPGLALDESLHGHLAENGCRHFNFD